MNSSVWEVNVMLTKSKVYMSQGEEFGILRNRLAQEYIYSDPGQ